MKVPTQLHELAGERRIRRSEQQEEAHRKIEAGDFEGANSPERMAKRMARLAMNQEKIRLAGAARLQPFVTSPAELTQPEELLERRFERIIGKDNLVDIVYLDRAIHASRTVVRVAVRGPGGKLQGYGTGFMVSPRVMITNQHVLSSSDLARNSQIQFNYQNDASGSGLAPTVFGLSPEGLFLTSPMDRLDYALVAVNPLSIDRTPLRLFGWNRLIEFQGKAIIGEVLNVIQHPSGQPKQMAHRDNLLIDILDDYLHYETDTLRGSSGSPVYNDDWEVVALHHSGVPKMKNGKVLKKDGRPASSDTPDSEIDWIANEGVRISRILKDLQNQNLAARTDERLVTEVLDPPTPPIEEALGATTRAMLQPPSAPDERDNRGASPLRHVWTFPLTISVELATPESAEGRGIRGSVTGGKVVSWDSGKSGQFSEEPVGVRGALPEEVELAASDYDDREGYDEEFLGGDELLVPLPELGSLASDAAQLKDGSGNVLKYTHFSAVLSGSRRFPLLTGVNIDGEELKRLPRNGDRWYFDPRVVRESQAGNEVYKYNDLDRGHMVRRLDPVWGNLARQANEDTFHYTNACPQHSNLNQRTWNDLEDYLLDNAGAQELKVSIFTGPVLRPDDPPYRGIRLPREFWKVAVLVNEQTGRLSATAYLLSQESMLTDLEWFIFGRFETYQVTVSQIESITGLRFGVLSAHDPLASGRTPDEELGAGGRRLISGAKDIVL